MSRAIRSWAGLSGASGIVVLSFLTVGQAPKPTPPNFKKDVVAVVDKFCIGCHSGTSPAAGLSLAFTKNEGLVAKNVDAWKKVITNVRSKHMPPTGMPAPTDPQRKALIQLVESKLKKPSKKTVATSIRRLNRAEYNNTIRDLLALDFRPAQDFPSDDVGYGFDNIADVLSISPLLMEKYLDAAEKIASAAIVIPSSRTVRYAGSELKVGSGGAPEPGRLLLYSQGKGTLQHSIPRAGLYKLRVQAWAQQAGPDLAKMQTLFDGKELGVSTISATQGKPQTIEYTIKAASPATCTVAVAFTNDWYDAKIGDRNLVVDSVEVVGPLAGNAPPPDSHLRVLPKPAASDGDLKQMLGQFASRAYRRPVSAEETDRLFGFVALARKAGEPTEAGVRVAVTAVLASPSFLFRIEDRQGSARLSGFELASRLSYFLWSSMPDDALFEAARNGSLATTEGLNREVVRMLRDPKSVAMSENFASQWLQLRKLDNFRADAERFPEFSKEFKLDAVQETRMFFDGVVRNDRSVVDFLDGNYSYVNARLAKVYGIPGVSGDQFRKVTIQDPRRSGVLTQASVLTVTSNPTRTSPTKRGKWVLENILGTPPPDPPPGVGVIPDEGKRLTAKSLRLLLEQHRKNPTCASCHRRMDPIGFGLENFDAMGRWRTKEDGFAVDAKGTLPDGRSFDGPVQLRSILLQNRDQFVHTLAERLTTYALGRGLNSADDYALDEVVQKAKLNNYRFSSIIQAIVTSDLFRLRGSARETI